MGLLCNVNGSILLASMAKRLATTWFKMMLIFILENLRTREYCERNSFGYDADS